MKDKNKFYETRAFRDEQRKWYQKLRKKGFDDVETPAAMDPKDRRNPHYFKNKYLAQEIDERRRYYELAGQMLHDHKFDTRRDRTIWEMHVRGLSIREIADKLGVGPFLIFEVVDILSKNIK